MRQVSINFIKDYKKEFGGSLLLAANVRTAKRDFKEIFTLRPFTRIVEWGRDFKNALSYQVLNQLESLGLISRKKKPSESTGKAKSRRKTDSL